MYLPKAHAFGHADDMLAHIEHHPLGAWVSQCDECLVANHVPFFLDRTQGPHGCLMGHVSRANPVWGQMADGVPCVVMFMGVQTYITPAWYPGKAAHGKVVPTWNYVSVHAHGVARVVDDRAWLLRMLNHLTNAQEASRPAPWSVTDVPRDHLERMLRGIVGVEIAIERLEGRLKVSQDEEMADRIGTVEGLEQAPDTAAQAMAGLVRRALDQDAG